MVTHVFLKALFLNDLIIKLFAALVFFFKYRSNYSLCLVVDKAAIIRTPPLDGIGLLTLVLEFRVFVLLIDNFKLWM